MNFEAILNDIHSKEMSEKIAAFVVKHPQRLDDLLACFFSKDIRLCQRAAWPIGKLGVLMPELLYPHLESMLKNLDNPPHDAIVRNTLRTMEEMDIPEDLEGEVFERCFNYIINLKSAVAIRAFAIPVCAKIAMKYPELKAELIDEFETQSLHATSAAIKHRLKKYLAKLKK